MYVDWNSANEMNTSVHYYPSHFIAHKVRWQSEVIGADETGNVGQAAAARHRDVLHPPA